jgi:ssDNA-binding replication factor A large subunit
MAEGEPAGPTAPVELRLRDFRPMESPIIIVARIVSAERREITRRSDGGKRPVLSGLLSDGTATIRFTWWDPPNEEVERGMVLRAGPIQIREFRGRPEITFTWKTRVAPASEADLPELSPDELPARRVADLAEGDEGFRLELRVARVEAKTVSVGQERRLLHEGVAFDGSGSIPFTAWSDFRLIEGEAIRVLGAYVGAFRGQPQLILDERAHVQRSEGPGLPTLDAWRIPPPSAIGLLEAARGSGHSTVEGTVVGLSPPSGLVYRCPNCSRGVSGGLCRAHGAVEGIADLRARVVLDDGTGAITINLDRAGTERLWGHTLEDALAELRERPDPAWIEEEIHAALFGHRLGVTGRSTADDFGLTMYPEEVRRLCVGEPTDLGRLRAAAEGRGR